MTCQLQWVIDATMHVVRPLTTWYSTGCLHQYYYYQEIIGLSEKYREVGMESFVWEEAGDFHGSTAKTPSFHET